VKLGIILPIAGEEDDIARYAEIRDLALRAEAADLDSVWVFDHLLFRSGDGATAGIWEAWSVLAALAEATERITLGTLVMCTGFRNPALLAKMADTLDEISGGRLILGLGAGWNDPEFEAFGMPNDHKVSRFEEALAIIVPLLREGRVDYRGSYYSAPECVLIPRGPRPGGPPILIGAAGPRMLGLTARWADAWNTCWLGLPTKLPERRAELHEACAAAGRDPATLEVTVGVTVGVPDPNEPATDDEPADPDKVLTGTADEIAAGLRAYQAEGAGHLICSLAPGDRAALDRFLLAVERYRATASA
jgi:probable F420-dependent oxidoreductase